MGVRLGGVAQLRLTGEEPGIDIHPQGVGIIVQMVIEKNTQIVSSLFTPPPPAVRQPRRLLPVRGALVKPLRPSVGNGTRDG